MDMQRRFQNAAHESAHAFFSHHLKMRPVQSLHLFTDAAGFVSLGKMPQYDSPRDAIENLLIVSLAGQQAGDRAQFTTYTIAGKLDPQTEKLPQRKKDKIKFGQILTHKPGDSADQENESDAEYEARIARKIYPESYRAFVYWLSQETDAQVKKHWKEILAVAKPLFRTGYISRNEFLQIIKETKR